MGTCWRGLLTTGAEAVSDFSDGVDLKDFANLALNLGLSGAAFVGLGGIGKGIKAAAELGKVSKKYKNVDELITVAKKFGDEKTLAKLSELKKRNYNIN